MKTLKHFNAKIALKRLCISRLFFEMWGAYGEGGRVGGEGEITTISPPRCCISQIKTEITNSWDDHTYKRGKRILFIK